MATAEERIMEFEAVKRTANEQAERWREEEKSYVQGKREDHRTEWMTFYLKIAESHERSAELAREKAWSLDA